MCVKQILIECLHPVNKNRTNRTSVTKVTGITCLCETTIITFHPVTHSLTKFNLLISIKDFKPIWFQSMDITYFQTISTPKRFIFCIKYFWLHIIKIIDKVRFLMYNWTIFTCHRTFIDSNSNVFIL